MNDDIMRQLWSWSVHTGDSLFADAAKEIERLRALIIAWADAAERLTLTDPTDDDYEAYNRAVLAVQAEVGR